MNMGDHPPQSSTPAAATGASYSAPTPRPSSSNVLPNTSPSNPNESPESNNAQNSNPSNPTASGSSPSPTSPTSPIGTGPSTRGHHRIGSSSTNTSYYPSWLPRRPPPPEPPGSTVGGMGTRPSTRAGFDSPDDSEDFDWELVVGPEAAREQALNSSDGEDAPRTSREQRRHTHSGLPTAGPSQPIAPKGERKPTPRSVRIVSVPGGSQQVISGPGRTRDTSETTRVPSVTAPPPAAGSGGYTGARAFSRATGSALVSPTLFSSFPSRGGSAGVKTRYSRTGRSSTLPPMAIHMMQNPAAAIQPTPMGPHPIQHMRPPRFRTPKFHPTLLRDPSGFTRARFYFWGLFVIFGHIIFQSFLDFNLVYMMIQVAKYPTPSPLGTQSSQRNWTLATVAYIACWVIWLFGVVLLYESIYCFWRRWRVKRPLVIPIYLSSPAFNLVSLTSYTNFCFLQHIRWSALGEYTTLTDESEIGSLARKPAEQPAVEEQPQGEGGDAERHRAEQSPLEQHRQEEAEAKPTEGGEQRAENPNSESSISYATPSNGNGEHQSTPESAKRNSGPTPSQNGKHQRQFSQARTISSAPSKGRFSEGVESSDGIALSEGRPQISELASDHEDEIVSAADAKRERTTDANRPTEAAIPFPRKPGPRGADGSAFIEQRMSFSSVSSSSSVGSSRFSGRNILQFIAESCWFYSQNLPTIVTLVPRLALTLALYLAFEGPSTGATLGSDNSLGRDGTFFGGHGELSGYAKVIIWLQIAWGLWRIVVLLGSWIGLWMLSGLGCAGLCGPRYRWEEMSSGLEGEEGPLPYLRRDEEKRREGMAPASGDEQAEAHAYSSRRHSRLADHRLSSFTIADPRFSDRTGRRAFSDPDDHTLNWPWMERCRDRIWDTWEFCLTPSATAQRGGDQQDAYWHAWRSAGAPPAGETERTRQMSEKQLQPTTSGTVPVAGSSGPAPMSHGHSSTATAVGTPIPFNSLSASSYGAMGLPAYQAGPSSYGQMDTMLSTLQEMSSNPSLAPSSGPAGVSPPAVPQPLPIFSTPQAPRRGILSQDLFSGPLPDIASTPAKPDDGAWLGSSAVPLAGPQSDAAPILPYPFPAYSSSQPSPKAALPFPLAPVVVANEQSVIQVPPPSRHPANVFPTPAPTIQSLPFPIPQSGGSSAGMSPGRQPQEELAEYYDDAEHGVLAHMRSHIGSQGTGSMSSLGQPIQSRYPIGYRRPRGRRSSASASGSGVASSHRISDAEASPLGSQQRSPRDSFMSGSGSGSGYGSQAMVRSQRSRISGVSNEYAEEDAYYEEEESLGSRISSPVGPGMAGVGAGGGLGPRGSLLNLGSQPQTPIEEYALDPPPRHPSGSRRRAGTLPSPSSSGIVPPPIVPPLPGPVDSVRGRLSSAPSQPSSSTREYFAPIPGQDIDMPTFAQVYGPDDDDEFGGSQEAAEREDSVGLLSQAPSRRSSASGLNLRSRASQISLQRRSNNSRPGSLTSPTHPSAGAVRSRTTSFIGRQAAESRESLHSGSRGSLAVPEARSRAGSDAGPSEKRTSQSSDTRSRTHSGTGSHLEGSVESAGPGPGHDMTFGVQVDWQAPDAGAAAEGQGENIATSQRTSGPGQPGLASASRASLQVPGPSTRSRPIDINAPAGSRADISSANASFVTALPSVAGSTTDTVGISEGSSERTWERGRSNRYFMEGGAGALGPR